MHVSTRDECRIERRIVLIAQASNLGIGYRKHTRLTITMNGTTGYFFQFLLRYRYIFGFRIPMIAAMSGNLMPFTNNTLNDIRSILGKICCTKERSLNAMLLQAVQYTICAESRNLHRFL